METAKTVTILISGKAGSGKSTLAEYITKHLAELESITSTRYSFAEPIKYIAKAFMGWDGKKDDRGRELLQNIGQIARKYDASIWVRHMFNQLDKRTMIPFNFVIVDDWRFPNEKDVVGSNSMMDVVTIRVEGRDTTIQNEKLREEVSETSLPDTIPTDILSYNEEGLYNFVVDNGGTCEELSEKAKLIVEELKSKYIL